MNEVENSMFSALLFIESLVTLRLAKDVVQKKMDPSALKKRKKNEEDIRKKAKEIDTLKKELEEKGEK